MPNFVNILRKSLFMLMALLPSVVIATSVSNRSNECPLVKVDAERLPDLNVARSGHMTLLVNGEPTVFGGHTKGFLPTSTVEYLHDGQWHVLQTTYTHDDGLFVPLNNGKVLMAGGHEKSLGIGQSFEVETYDPALHSFDGFGCLDTKRCLASGSRLSNGQVVISGNWYEDDALEVFDSKENFVHAKATAQNRTIPYIFHTAADDAIIFSPLNAHGQSTDTIIIDRLKGEPFLSPFFEKWKPLQIWQTFNSDDSFIGNISKGNYAYLLPVTDRDGQLAIAKAEGASFSLLPTACTIPMTTTWGKINYLSHVIVDRGAQRGYLCGFGEDQRIYILAIDYAQMPASLVLYHTEPLPVPMFSIPMLTANGNLMMAGGTLHDNFKPSNQVYLLRVGNSETTTPCLSRWKLFVICFLLIAAILLLVIMIKRIQHHKGVTNEHTANASISDTPQLSTADEILINRICKYIEKEKPYLNSRFKITDLANALGTNRNAISACINTQKACNFTQFVNQYRVEYAKHLMLSKPDIKIFEIYVAAGFANETTFFRAFKNVTGMTPNEWKSTNN